MDFKAVILVSLVAGPDNIKATAAPIDMPEASQVIKIGMVPPPHKYKGTPRVADSKTPKPLFLPKSSAFLLRNSSISCRNQPNYKVGG